MAEIRNYTLNFSSGRSRWSLNFLAPSRKLASTEVELPIAEAQRG